MISHPSHVSSTNMMESYSMHRSEGVTARSKSKKEHAVRWPRYGTRRVFHHSSPPIPPKKISWYHQIHVEIIEHFVNVLALEVSEFCEKEV